jgi:hypothetical protein
MTTTPSPLRIGNVSASRTDRATATAEFLGAASLDVLALDMLSDEAMLALAAARSGGGPGYEPAALVQLGECLDLIGAGGVRIVTNAGALDPEGLAVELRARASDAGIDLLVGGRRFRRRDRPRRRAGPRARLTSPRSATGRSGSRGPWPPGRTWSSRGRVSREALVTGAAAAHHGWTSSALDALAGSVAVGHVLSGGPGATGVVDSSTDVTRPPIPSRAATRSPRSPRTARPSSPVIPPRSAP